MRRRRWMFLLVPLGIALFVFIGGEIVLHLWNWLLPPLFGWRMLTFWQAIGLLVLCRILFGRFGGPPFRHSFRRRMGERWTSMTPEEREKFHQGMRGRCGSFGADATASESKA